MTRRGRCHSGLASLEWLLVIAAVGGFAAVMAVAVQRLVDDAADTAADPAVRLLEARVLAADLSKRAADAAAGNGGLDLHESLLAELRRRCERIPSSHPGAVSAAQWAQVRSADSAPAKHWTCRLTGLSP